MCKYIIFLHYLALEAIPGDLSKNFTEVRFLEAELKGK